jgi:hypothetical protein
VEARGSILIPPLTLECATASSLGGWEPDDAMGRQFVPGQVALMDANGAVSTAVPETIATPVFEIASLLWDDFKGFLACRQRMGKKLRENTLT